MYTTLRMIHIIFGIFVGGSYLFMIPILQPRLKKLGPAIQGPVMRALMPIMTPIMGLSFIVIMGTGVAMTLMLRQGSLATLFTTGWGWDIIIGTVATVAAIVVGFGFLVPTGIRQERLGRSIGGRVPTPAEGKQLQQLSKKAETLSRVNFTFIMIAVVTMVIVRYL